MRPSSSDMVTVPENRPATCGRAIFLPSSKTCSSSGKTRSCRSCSIPTDATISRHAAAPMLALIDTQLAAVMPAATRLSVERRKHPSRGKGIEIARVRIMETLETGRGYSGTVEFLPDEGTESGD
jgi:hypothetical protein